MQIYSETIELPNESSKQEFKPVINEKYECEHVVISQIKVDFRFLNFQDFDAVKRWILFKFKPSSSVLCLDSIMTEAKKRMVMENFEFECREKKAFPIFGFFGRSRWALESRKLVFTVIFFQIITTANSDSGKKSSL